MGTDIVEHTVVPSVPNTEFSRCKSNMNFEFMFYAIIPFKWGLYTTLLDEIVKYMYGYSPLELLFNQPSKKCYSGQNGQKNESQNNVHY